MVPNASGHREASPVRRLFALRAVAGAMLAACLLLGTPQAAQQRAADGVLLNAHGDPQYATFSLCAVDPVTRQSGAAVTTRVPFVGRAVPHVRAGVGAVCTQASTRVEYGPRGLDLLAKGVEPRDVLQQLLADDQQRESRQVGVIDMQGRSAAHTGKQNGNWAGSRQGPNYTVQANIMVGPEVVDAVAASFEFTEGTGLPYTTARKLGYRTFSRVEGPDVLELKRMLHALGFWRPELAVFPDQPPRELSLFDEEAIAAVDKFRAAHGLTYQGNPAGLVDARFVDALRAAYIKKRKGTYLDLWKTPGTRPSTKSREFSTDRGTSP